MTGRCRLTACESFRAHREFAHDNLARRFAPSQREPRVHACVDIYLRGFTCALSSAIAEKEAQVEQLLVEMDDGKAEAEQDTVDQGQESDEIDLAVHLAPLSRDELELLVAQLVAWRPEIGERVLEIAHKPADVNAIPYRVQQLTQARATPSEFAEEILPFAKKAHDYALAGDMANARALAEALTRSIGAAYPKPGWRRDTCSMSCLARASLAPCHV